LPHNHHKPGLRATKLGGSERRSSLSAASAGSARRTAPSRGNAGPPLGRGPKKPPERGATWGFFATFSPGATRRGHSPRRGQHGRAGDRGWVDERPAGAEASEV